MKNPSVTQNLLAPSPFLEFQEREKLLSHGKANLFGARCTLLSIFCRLGQRNQAKRKDTLTREISRMKEICNLQYIWLNDAITTRRITTIMAYENTALGSKVTKVLTFSCFFFTNPSAISGSEVCEDCIKTIFIRVCISDSFCHDRKCCQIFFCSQCLETWVLHKVKRPRHAKQSWITFKREFLLN